ncbi:MAG TPA: hypothetical protein VGD67_17190 [Pseudonocardiaceae bacterium]
MPAAAPVAPPAEPADADVRVADLDADLREVPQEVWDVDRLPASARVADRVLSTCRAAGCAPLTDRRAARGMALRRTVPVRRWSR